MFYYQLYLNPKEHKSAVVFLHAFPLNSKMWEPQFGKLREKNIPFLALDYPGFGKSALWTKEPSMDDFADLAYHSINRLDLGKVIIVGLSMGGYVALALYRKYPDIFKGLVLANTRAVADSDEGKRKRFKLVDEIRNDPAMRGLIRLHLQKFFTDEISMNKPELPPLAESLMKEAKPIGVIHALQAMAGRADSTDLLQKMDFPVLVVAGEKDSLTSVDDARAMTDQLQKAKLSVLSDAAHLSNLEKAEEFNEILMQYLLDLGEA